MTINQISIFLENKSGQLSEIAGILAENNIDLRALYIAETMDYAVLRIISTNAEEASRVLLSQGFILSMTPVVAVEIPDEPGGLARLLEVLAKAECDLEYVYSVFGKKEGMAYMILRVADINRLEDILDSNGLNSVGGEQLGID